MQNTVSFAAELGFLKEKMATLDSEIQRFKRENEKMERAKQEFEARAEVLAKERVTWDKRMQEEEDAWNRFVQFSSAAFFFAGVAVNTIIFIGAPGDNLCTNFLAEVVVRFRYLFMRPLRSWLRERRSGEQRRNMPGKSRLCSSSRNEIIRDAFVLVPLSREGRPGRRRAGGVCVEHIRACLVFAASVQ
jgi:hypothetical protein